MAGIKPAMTSYLISEARGLIRLGAEKLTTLAHFSVSSARSLPNSAGEPASGEPPVSARRALMAASAKAALIAALSVSMISAGVSLGAPMPVAALAS